jgi:hypothetical protein
MESSKKTALHVVGPGRDPAPEQLVLQRTVARSFCKDNISIAFCTKKRIETMLSCDA